MFREGATIKVTMLSEAFTIRDFYDRHGEEAIVLMTIAADGKLKIGTTQNPLQPVAGESVIAIVPKKDDAAVNPLDDKESP